ncbi:cytokine-dependent hematopoietic cell linker isoform X2 [Nelusetta ayraudi]|uniref:cytokine-dependent hematopoietic cell linker isoform X2 n=1 Tax=Nelusetta ayraudi TaxID=303726 RepID=UPI003F728693
MDRRWVTRNQDLKWANHSDVSESEYDVVDDQEELLDVHILPARPMYDDTEYADRDILESSPVRGLSSPPIQEHCATVMRRPSPMTQGPAINRELKPGRGKARFGKTTSINETTHSDPHSDAYISTPADKRSLPPLPGGQHDQSYVPTRSSPRIPNFTQGQADRRPAPDDNSGRREQRLKNTGGLSGDFSSHLKGPHSTDRASASQFRQMEPLECDTSNTEKRPKQWMEPTWPLPQASENQRGHIPEPTPDQRHCEEEWYVGSCNRTDAEHALHLVNKDGAFLVRDCSIDNDSEPLVLVVYNEKKVYNVKIRFIKDTGKYALGMQQTSNNMFDTVIDIIKYHSIFPIILVSGRTVTGSRNPETCLLTCPVTRMDVQQLLQ